MRETEQPMKIRSSRWIGVVALGSALACTAGPDAPEAETAPQAVAGNVGVVSLEARCLLENEDCDGYGKCCAGLTCESSLGVTRCRKKKATTIEPATP
jgi:hypothetical protein